MTKEQREKDLILYSDDVSLVQSYYRGNQGMDQTVNQLLKSLGLCCLECLSFIANDKLCKSTYMPSVRLAHF